MECDRNGIVYGVWCVYEVDDELIVDGSSIVCIGI